MINVLKSITNATVDLPPTNIAWTDISVFMCGTEMQRLPSFSIEHDRSRPIRRSLLYHGTGL